jgi:hypothetical protein
MKVSEQMPHLSCIQGRVGQFVPDAFFHTSSEVLTSDGEVRFVGYEQ